MRMNAADTSASIAIADCTPLAVASRSSTTDEIDTFIRDVSTTSTNIAMASKIGNLLLLLLVAAVAPSTGSSSLGESVTPAVLHCTRHPRSPCEGGAGTPIRRSS